MTTMKLRLTGFALAIVLVAFMIAWAAHASWLRVARLSEKLTSVQITSFRTADYFRADLVELNYTLLRYEIHHNPSDREHFLKNLNKLNEWIDVQSPLLTTTKEALILNQINAAYDGYYSAATNHLSKIDAHVTSVDASFGEFEKVGDVSDRLLALAYKLVDAHHESLARFVADSQRSLGFLRVLIFASLLFLLMLVAWLAGVVYREMIHPLRLKLVETNAILERQEKLASLGVLAAGVAHEIRNPLTAIKARLFTQQKVLSPGSSEFEDAAVIGNEINRLERIVKGVLQFARPPEPKLATLLASSILREVQDLMAPQLAAASIQVKLELNGGAYVQADAEQLKQVLINLVQNAAESIKDQGQVILRERTGTARLSGQSTQVVILEVEDSGKGISPEVQKRLFDPFFSTKDSGTGLGLSIAARILEKHGGVLEFQTQLNHGTTFGVILPQT